MSGFVGDKIKTLRKARNLTFIDLRVKTGLGLTTIQLAERAGVVSARTAALLAPALGVAAEDITPKPRRARR
jgi:transcriptional regulator with XRE-family HTH domain